MPSRRRQAVTYRPTEAFNPLDPRQIEGLLRGHLEQQPLEDFPPSPFQGAGLYALYYVGDLPLYEKLANKDYPIYVGKAEAGNSSYGYDPDNTAPKLWKRISEKHAGSVQEVENAGGNLRLQDFRVRYMALDDAWIVLGERALLRAYRPVLWNTIMSGFGSNPSGAARQNPKSVWDTVHPGRRRARPFPNRLLTLAEMEERICSGIDICLAPEGAERVEALTAFREKKYPVIWMPAKDKDDDKRFKVLDPGRFHAEVERLGLTFTEEDYVETPQLELASEGDDDSSDDIADGIAS